MARKEKDFDEELRKLARKSNFNIKQSEFSFTKQLRKLDAEIDEISNKQISDFDDNLESIEEYLTIDYKTPFIDRYRELLKKM